jgi:thioredoxin 1
MKKHKLLFLSSFVLFFIYLSFFCSQEQKRLSGEDPTAAGDSSQSGVIVTDNLDLDFSKHKVTFIELGADRCVPCRAMQPIMREIAVEYSGKIQVVFYDVWKDPRPARKYGIQLIPTQVFIDQKGKEIFRHVGFFPEEEILGMLKEKGIL